MITPEDVLDLADRLARSSGEASHRSAASRAYFAAFLHLRQQVDARLEAPPRRSAGDHGRVERVVSEIDPGAGRTLARLRSVRNVADYDVQEEFVRSRAEVAVLMAQRAVGIRIRG